MARPRGFEAGSPKTSRCEYDVFLSFRGEDTRKNFTDHLYTALVQAGIHSFRDDDEISRGESIRQELQSALESSKAAIVVFSKDYCSSRWCLDELVTIMERRSSSGLIVIPVFYDVDPSQVRNQTGSYAQAFSLHEEQLKEDRARVCLWCAALRQVGDLAGMFLQNKQEALFIQEIVQDIANGLNRKALHVSPYTIGVYHHVKKLNSWLQDQSSDVRIVIIPGIGGIGKTTIAKIVYNQNYRRFQGSSFLANINRRTSEEPTGMLCLQRQLLSDVLKVKSKKIYNEDEGIVKIKDAICCKRVLIVLDDVDELEQFNAILGSREWLFPGSKMIVTTRRSRLIHDEEDCRMLEVGVLNADQSLQLLSLHAFGQSHPPPQYTEQTRTAANYSGGLPLAVQVLGSTLFGSTIDVWESALQEMIEIPHPTVQKILRMSYNSLQNDRHRNLFLDISCFFIGMDKDYAITIADGCGYQSKAGIEHLTDRCLIAIDEQNKIMMHQLIRDMGGEIIREESPEEPEKRSRLWNHNDAFIVMSENRATKSIKGLNLRMPLLGRNKHASVFWNLNHGKRDSNGNFDELPYTQPSAKRYRLSWFSWKPIYGGPPSSRLESDEVDLETKAFAKMEKLKLLQLHHVKLNGGYTGFPKSLAWLCWHGLSLHQIPHELFLENLVVLDIQNSSMKQLWKGTRCLPKLKILNLSHSHLLLATPDFSGLPCLERLMLKNCRNLVKIDESIGELKRIVLLNLKHSKKLKKLPGTIARLESLEELVLSGCSQLDLLPVEGLKSRVVVADGIAIEGLHRISTRTKNQSLRSILRTWFLPRQSFLSTSFSFSFLPRSLVRLSLAHCNLSDDHIPSDLTFLPALQHLDLSFNPIQTIPGSIHSLNLLTLWLKHCPRLQSLPPLPKSLEFVFLKGCTSLERIAYLPGFSASTGCYRYGCQNLVEVGGVFKLNQVSDLDIEMINRLSMLNLDSIGNIEVEVANTLTDCMRYTSRTTSPQVLHEYGIFTFFLSGSEIPDWYFSVEGTSLSFLVPHFQHSCIIGLNFCAVYALDNSSANTYTESNFVFPEVRIHNKTKNSAWAYSPTFYEVPGVSEDKRWFSHCSFGDQFESGDKVTVAVTSRFCYSIKKFGIHVVFEQENHGGDQSITSSPWYQSLSEVNISPYRLDPSVTTFLADTPLSLLQSVPSISTTSWFQILSDPGFLPHQNMPERFFYLNLRLLEVIACLRWLVQPEQDEENNAANPSNLLPEIQGILGSVREINPHKLLELVAGTFKKFPWSTGKEC